MSLDPIELKNTIEIIRKAESALGNSEKRILDDEKENRIKLRKSIIAIKDLNIGEVITFDSIAIMRPQTGLPPVYYDKLIGKKIKKNILKNNPVQKNDIDWS